MSSPKGKRLLTKIHSKWYDLTAFERIHPGGPVSLGLAAGRDGTVLFESHHPFTHRHILEAILQKYELDEASSRGLRSLEEEHGIAEHKFEWKSEFGEALRAEVRDYFQGEATRRKVPLLTATKATPERWAEIATIALVFALNLLLLVRGHLLATLTFPLAAWMLGVNTFHDAAHFALSRNWRVNWLVPYLYPHFSSPFVWYHQHNIGHHGYPNIAHRDPDLLHTFWLKREHRFVRWRPAHAHQRKSWFLVFWWSVAVEFGLTTTEDLRMVLYKVYNESVPMKAVSGARLGAHILGRVLTLGVIHCWPFYVFEGAGWARCLVFATVPYMIFSFLFMMNTQINHLTPESTHEGHGDWFKHQVLTAQNFGVRSRLCFLMSGGLNFQIEHHLFPTVNHCHLVKLQPMVARLCEKHGVAYKHVAGYVDAIRAHVQHTVDLSFDERES